MLAFVMCAVLATTPEPQAVEESITVSRILLDVRVTDAGGELITNLTAADFDVRVDGRRLVVESAEWIDDARGASWKVAEPSTGPAGQELIPLLEDSTKGRLLVFFVQTDFARHPSRVAGHLKFVPYMLEMIDSLQPADRVAVFSIDSHLKFRLDFTTDREAAREALQSTVLIDDPAPPAAVPEPALGPRLNRREMRRVRDSEGALLVIANALEKIPGPKSLLLLGWGLGQRTPTGNEMKWRWKHARPALEPARVTIFSFDTTYANSHDLEVGLKIAAKETGGMYLKTFEFPRAAMERVRRTLRGHYELELRATGNVRRPGWRQVDIRTTGAVRSCSHPGPCSSALDLGRLYARLLRPDRFHP